MSKLSKKNGRRKPMAEINVVPYIDVTLVLLIIFMVTTPMLQTGVDVDLPEASSKAVEVTDDPPIIISIEKSGQYSIKIDDADNLMIQPEAITELVIAALAKKPKTQVYISADKSVEYGKVITVMADLKNAGVDKVGFSTKAKSEDQ
ncbi:protein TolR [Methylovulum psychrotolerans]|jgi:biopolymer transport protein TolR|uniref:Tol-Pal system protein TolR n=1 Tax=Methylovulum psychrotolerans TaxID=1704499 RepID=A0A1Z4BVB8_9GAMM|nr:protein TolR [Methylovulum psychrotolerans]ASF45241.1 protein TolR [Methylovulum psychrotolerans]POZ53203.1 protein TolR [Methylovulum psychrotolerans]